MKQKKNKKMMKFPVDTTSQNVSGLLLCVKSQLEIDATSPGTK